MSPNSDGRLRGVGSGAAIWAVGSIGVACGLGYLKEAAFIAILIFIVLNVFDWLELRTKKTDFVKSGGLPTPGVPSDCQAEHGAAGSACAIYARAQCRAELYSAIAGTTAL